MRRLLESARRALRKPPRVIARRLIYEINAEVARYTAKSRAKRLTATALVRATRASDLETLWRTLSQRPYPTYFGCFDEDASGVGGIRDLARVLAGAERALAHEVDLVGSGRVALGRTIDWHKDYKTGLSWPVLFFRDLEYQNPDRPSDVKFPWELSRCHWLIPAGQAFLLTREERYAECARLALDQWISANPYCRGVNWACTMEVALRILTWTWLFHACKESHAWSDARFRARFLATLYLHCEYTQRHLEFTDVNSNHYVANAAGLVFGGLFFGAGVQPQRWAKLGWDILCSELPRQVAADGVDFEGSVPYHRLVLELFLLPARFRLACGLDVEWAYSQRVGAMAEFSRTYTRDDGSSPLLGDADDGRALPLGGQPIGDHSYLLPLFERTFGPESAVPSGQAWTELLWHLGPTAVQQPYSAPQTVCSRAFREGGIYVMRNSVDHVFIDCAPVGLAGRGGHGHNDCLSFEAALDGAHLISDCGSYVYTADYDARNRFRATAAHNTPQIDGEEMNRFLTRAYLFNLRYDAVPEVLQWASGPAHDIFCGTHSGYCRLEEGLRPIRTITLEHATHTLTIQDRFEQRGPGSHSVEIPFHLAISVRAQQHSASEFILTTPTGKSFRVQWSGDSAWGVSIEDAEVSPSYGARVSTQRLMWRSARLTDLTVRISPADETSTSSPP